MEYLNFAKNRLPKEVTPQLGPDATGVGWVFMYTLSDFLERARVLRDNLSSKDSKPLSLADLPEPQDKSPRYGSEVPVYSGGQLEKFFATKKVNRARFTRESIKYLKESFDLDQDGYISKEELLAAAEYRGTDLAKLRSLQDWYLRYELMSVPGVSEVASVGGFVRQYQVEVDPEKLRAFNIPLNKVKSAIARSNIDSGGRVLEMGETEYMVRGKGYIRGIDDLESIPLKVDEDSHTPVLLKQVADIHLGPEIRRGIVEMDGLGEVVSGIVVMRSGENALKVIDAVKNRLGELCGAHF